MPDLLPLALDNLLSPIILFFALGFGAAMLRSDLSVPEAFAKAMALYLMLAIGFKGGVELNKQGLDWTVGVILLAGAALSFLIPLIAYTLLRIFTRLGQADAAAVAAHYGSISVVTFVAGSEFLTLMGIGFEGYMVAVMAIMETPAIVTGIWLARRNLNGAGGQAPRRSRPGLLDRDLMREIFLNGSVVILIGAFAIGWITGPKGLDAIAPFVVAPFKGVLCLFLLDMGLVAATRLRGASELTWRLVLFGLAMPVIGASLGLATGWALSLGAGETALLALLAGSASYIAVPASMRLAVPEASPGIYLTLSLAITFPFNLTLGIPLYFSIAAAISSP
ncbi:sodium-dependent bicarbonate transport family permease [Pelagibius litoralis]|uniref:Sodium-dependent bicarbonate transport family permease n=1 Tax=Pelagibius litoralis TaxID=374515 RepID=A0A967CB94_9PROT|nr:sodium-dependent bicarbonate transport family permease [Pelagibius litoralis]NIA68024.1 sodium-dependent bicarbonate transport family permease [Pelagibius litoralis]